MPPPFFRNHVHSGCWVSRKLPHPFSSGFSSPLAQAGARPRARAQLLSYRQLHERVPKAAERRKVNTVTFAEAPWELVHPVSGQQRGQEAFRESQENSWKHPRKSAGVHRPGRRAALAAAYLHLPCDFPLCFFFCVFFFVFFFPECSEL